MELKYVSKMLSYFLFIIRKFFVQFPYCFQQGRYAQGPYFPITGCLPNIFLKFQGFQGFFTHFYPVFQGFYPQFLLFIKVLEDECILLRKLRNLFWYHKSHFLKKGLSCIFPFGENIFFQGFQGFLQQIDRYSRFSRSPFLFSRVSRFSRFSRSGKHPDYTKYIIHNEYSTLQQL